MSTTDAGRTEDHEHRDESTHTAVRLTLDEVFERIEGQDLGHLTSEDAVAVLEAERARRMTPAASSFPKRSTSSC